MTGLEAASPLPMIVLPVFLTVLAARKLANTNDFKEAGSLKRRPGWELSGTRFVSFLYFFD